MAVHAHPDDEASGTGGVLARYADEGVRTVLVTCTNGELRRRPGRRQARRTRPRRGRSSACVRRASWRPAARCSGVSHLELLGYHDSGMEGWPQNDAPGSFWSTPVDEAAARLAELMRALPAPGRRHLRRERLLRPPGPHPGPPDHDGRHRRVQASPQGVLHGRAPLGIAAWATMLAEAGIELRPRSRRTPTSARPTSRSPPRWTARGGRPQVRLAGRARQPERQHLLPADG